MLRQLKRGLRLGTLSLLVALVASGSRAEDSAAATEITRLGGTHACVRKPLKSGADLQKMFTAHRKDLDQILTESGWGGQNEDVFRAVAEGNFAEIQVPVGTTIPWMAMRRNKKLEILRNGRWAGKEPFEAFEIRLSAGDADYRFMIPKLCGNLALLEVTAVPAPVCKVSASPAKDCITRNFTIDASGSSVAAGRIASVEVSVTKPDGSREPLGNPDRAGSWSWTRSYRQPGTYTFSATATSDRGKKCAEPATARVEVTPCPPSTALSLYEDERYTGEMFTIDTSGSKAQVGQIKTVHVECTDPKGAAAGTWDLTSPFKTETTFTKAGVYNCKALAEDDLGQKSLEWATASITILSRVGVVADFFGGKERLEREEFNGGRCAPLIGAKGGVAYLVNRSFEVAGLVGAAANTRDTENWAMMADLEANWLGKSGFFGAGIGGWALNDEDVRAADALVHFGVNLPWKTPRRNVALFVEGRCMLDKLDEIENNYVVLGGLRFHFGD